MERWLEAEIKDSIAQLYSLTEPMKNFESLLTTSLLIFLRIGEPLAKMKSEVELIHDVLCPL